MVHNALGHIIQKPKLKEQLLNQEMKFNPFHLKRVWGHVAWFLPLREHVGDCSVETISSEEGRHKSQSSYTIRVKESVIAKTNSPLICLFSLSETSVKTQVSVSDKFML